MIEVSDNSLEKVESGSAIIIYDADSNEEAWITGFVEVPQ